MKNNKKKGYALAIVVILIFVMTIVLVIAFDVLMRYLFFAKDNLQNLSGEVSSIDNWRSI